MTRPRRSSAWAAPSSTRTWPRSSRPCANAWCRSLLPHKQSSSLWLVAMEDIQSRMRDLGEFIREQRSVARLSLRKLSDMAGISNPYLSQIERGLRKTSAEILQQIAQAPRISAETLYVRAGLPEKREGEHDPVGEILRDPTHTQAPK